MVVANKAVSELRSLLKAHLQSLDDGASATEIVAAFRREHPSAVLRASQALEDIALTKLINEVGNRRSAAPVGQMDLFAGYGTPGALVLPAPGGEGGYIHKPITRTTVRELEAYVEMHLQPRNSTPAKFFEVQRLLEDIRPYATDGSTTVEDALRTARGERSRRVG